MPYDDLAAARRIALKASTDPFFCACWFVRYQQAHGNLEDDDLAAFLGIAPDDLPRLAICRTPGIDERHTLDADIAALCARWPGLSADRLRDVLGGIETERN